MRGLTRVREGLESLWFVLRGGRYQVLWSEEECGKTEQV